MEIKTEGPFEYHLLDDGTIRIRRYTGNESHVTVPDEFEGRPVTQIGMATFKDCLELQSVTLPKHLTYLGVQAFMNCQNLMYVDLNENLECISLYVFIDCPKMKQIVIPKGVKEFGIQPFPRNARFELIVYPGSPAETWALSHHYFAAGIQGELIVLKLTEEYSRVWNSDANA